MTGILETVRKLVGAGDSESPYDQDLLIHINSTLSTLNQIGAGPTEGFIADSTSQWTEFIPADSKKLEMIKSYVCLKVRLVFDPPASSSAQEAMNRTVDQYEWRIQLEVDPEPVIPIEGGESSV